MTIKRKTQAFLPLLLAASLLAGCTGGEKPDARQPEAPAAAAVNTDSGYTGEGFTDNDLDGAWDSSGAVRVTLTDGGAEVSGEGAAYTEDGLVISRAGRYVLTGELTDGGVTVSAGNGDKVWLLLDGVTVRNSHGAALLVTQAEKVFLTLAEGTENVLSSGGTYSEAALAEGVDGAVYSKDDLTINGGGSLTVEAEYKHGIVCNDDFVMTGGTVNITAAQDGIHAHDSARFTGMELTVSAGDDGITVSNDEETAYFYMESGSVSVPECYEGIEAIDLTVAGGTVDIRPRDDGLNANGQGGASVIRVTGGDISVINETGRDADGFDSNGSIFISGGSVFISVSSAGGSCALDAGTETGGVSIISGGTVIACGGSAMAEGFEGDSPQGFVMRSVAQAEAGAELSLKNAQGDTLLSAAVPCPFNWVLLSMPELKLGDSCVLVLDGEEQDVQADNSTAANGFGGFGGRGRGPRGFGGDQPQGDRPSDVPGGMPFGGFGPGGEAPSDIPTGWGGHGKNV